ncbi:cytidine deaminase-like isoform X2 [Protopterus annectens]|uniref:cytidine deaminase-like isoform X2 n=1 Tax=Protopterus annectens TaxID=7888 RepID=UPI001CFBAB7A|nr:cytidine deaminase-like isoform X2 [Protopterus annectens]
MQAKMNFYLNTARETMEPSMTDDGVIKELVKKCQEAKTLAYCPYSNFPVGAAVLTKQGQIFQGCNVENASYGLTVCAERTVIQKAVSEGYREFSAMAVTCDIKETVGPCGACRQVMIEFGRDWDVYLTKPDGSYTRVKLNDLLFLPFEPSHLDGPHTKKTTN